MIVFLKAPEKGKVKTRLSRGISDDLVLKLYRGFVRDTLDTVENTGSPYLFYWPRGSKTVLRQWLGNTFPFCLQRGKDLGERMANAFETIFNKGFESVLLVGTDIPELDRACIESAYDVLKKKDSVIGPSGDGGYYLIGFRQTGFSKEVFQNIDWSTPAVLTQTRKALDSVPLSWKLVEKKKDIDTPEDLAALVKRVTRGQKIGKRTRENLKRI